MFSTMYRLFQLRVEGDQLKCYGKVDLTKDIHNVLEYKTSVHLFFTT